MPWSDWEVSGDQIEICKRPDGMDWELGAGAFGKVGCVLSQHMIGLTRITRVQYATPMPWAAGQL